MDAYDRLAGAQATQGGNYIKDGEYDLTVLNVKKHNGQTGEESFIAEFLVDSAKATEPGVDPNPVGSTASLVCNITKQPHSINGFKGFIDAALAALGFEGACTGADMRAACSPAQPLRGLRLKDSTFRKPIKSGPNAGKPMTRHRFTPASVQTNEQRLARCAELDSKAAAPAPATDAPSMLAGAAVTPAAPQTSRLG